MEVVMTGTRGLQVALVALVGSTLVSISPAMAQGRPDQRRDDPRTSQRDRQDPRDTRDDRNSRDDVFRRGTPRFDLAYLNGEEDGYKEGQRDGEHGDRFDPVREKRYRSGDHGYDRRYGSKELYKDRYRDGFRRGYEDGYRDGRRYDRRSPMPNWWPFGR